MLIVPIEPCHNIQDNRDFQNIRDVEKILNSACSNFVSQAPSLFDFVRVRETRVKR